MLSNYQKTLRQISTSQKKSSKPTHRCYQARALDINCKTIDAIHLITGLGATLLPCSPEVSEVALVWRAILVALSLWKATRIFYWVTPQGTYQSISNSQGLCSVNKHFELFVQNRGISRNSGQLKEKNYFSVDIFIHIASTLRTAASCIIAHLYHDDIVKHIFKSTYMERCLHWAQ